MKGLLIHSYRSRLNNLKVLQLVLKIVNTADSNFSSVRAFALVRPRCHRVSQRP
jgi:hypothetical protein